MTRNQSLIFMVLLLSLSAVLGGTIVNQYSQAQQEVDTYAEYSKQQYDGPPVLLLQCVSVNDIDTGGLGYHLYQVIFANIVAESLGLSLVVKYSKGYYLDLEKGPNWFEYYFQRLHTQKEDDIATEVLDGIRRESAKPRSIYQLSGNFCKLPNPEDVYMYTQQSFKLLKSENLVNRAMLNKDWKFPLQLQPEVAARVDDFVHRKFKPNMLGIHYRGTDKYFNTGSNESMLDNYHPTYACVLDSAAKFLSSLENSNNWGIFVCSDEQAFVDATRKRFPDCCCTDAARSSISTSGLRMYNTDLCSNHTDLPQCREYRKLASNSAHRGLLHVRPYKKGLDAVTEIYLLSRCDAFLRNIQGGSFSLMPRLINRNLINFVPSTAVDDTQ